MHGMVWNTFGAHVVSEARINGSMITPGVRGIFLRHLWSPKDLVF